MSTTSRLLLLEGKISSTEKHAKPSYKTYVQDKKNKKEKPLPREDWEVRVMGLGGGRKKNQQKKVMRWTGKLQRDIYDKYHKAPWKHNLEELAKYAEDGALDESHSDRIEDIAVAVEKDVRDRNDKQLIYGALEALRESMG